MKAAIFAVLATACALTLGACGSDDSNGKTTPAASGGSGNAGSTSTGGDTAVPADACHDGCVTTLAAKCSNGPTDQSSCETTCQSLEAGKCGAEYATLQQCAEGKDITCSAQGLPTIAACPDQQAAFVACLN